MTKRLHRSGEVIRSTDVSEELRTYTALQQTYGEASTARVQKTKRNFYKLISFQLANALKRE